MRTPNGTPLLFEAYQRSSSLRRRAGARSGCRSPRSLLAGAPPALARPGPAGVAPRAQPAPLPAERESLLLKAVEASAGRAPPDRGRPARRRRAGSGRAGLRPERSRRRGRRPRRRRSWPRRCAPRRRRAGRRSGGCGLSSSRSTRRTCSRPGWRRRSPTCCAGLRARGVETTLELPDELQLTTEAELLVFRAASEALRNVERHAAATRVSVRVTGDGWPRAPGGRRRRQGLRRRRAGAQAAEGHVGLSLLDELAAGLGGRLDVDSAPGEGTRFVLEVPRVIRLLIADDHAVVRSRPGAARLRVRRASSWSARRRTARRPSPSAPRRGPTSS